MASMVRQPRQKLTVLSAEHLHCGDHISWPTKILPGMLKHHAIVVASKGGNIVKVIHVIPTKNGCEVCEEELDVGDHIKRKKLRYYDYNPQDVYEPYEVVKRAKSKLGIFEYDCLNNNCEHFVRWCKYNVSESAQASKAKSSTHASSGSIGPAVKGIVKVMTASGSK